MKGPCDNCPFRKDVQPFLTQRRGVELAALTRHPNGKFHCHETVYTAGGNRRPRRLWQLCIGFATLRAQEAGNRFVKPDETVYGSMGEMMQRYLEDGH
jgi:hypothetical protein